MITWNSQAQGTEKLAFCCQADFYPSGTIQSYEDDDDDDIIYYNITFINIAPKLTKNNCYRMLNLKLFLFKINKF